VLALLVATEDSFAGFLEEGKIKGSLRNAFKAFGRKNGAYPLRIIFLFYVKFMILQLRQRGLGSFATKTRRIF
jgi:hypothetical protein